MNSVSRRIYIFIILLFVVGHNQITFSNQTKYWIFFNDKHSNRIANITHNAMVRRELRGTIKSLSKLDIYPNENYIDSLKKAGLTLHQQSRWLNAVSVSGESARLALIKDFYFVKGIQPVATFTGKRIKTEDYKMQPWHTLTTGLDYGFSYNQLHMCQIDSLHSLGYSGKGVYVGMMDTGYDLNHFAFQRILESGRLIATHDFINGDDDVSDYGDFQQEHGTAVFSIIGGFDEGNLIGASYNANFILGKTEIVDDEIQGEEDNWVAAIEWMEALGVDVISSSLGYIDWYDTSQLDGNTAVITVVADIAASFGVVVVNAAGNERNSSWGRIIPPADGDSVIAVGGVTSTGQLYSQSSPGPTSDGRIKPDIMAQALGVWGAYYSSDGYRTFSGTSLSTPIIAGGLALILEAHPDWSLDKLYNSLRLTASNADVPDNDMGWGIARMFDMFAVDGYFIVVEPTGIVNQKDTVEIAVALFDSLSSPGGNHDIRVTLLAGTAELIGMPVPDGPDTLTQSVYFPFPGIQKLEFYDRVSQLSKVIEILVYGAMDIEFAAVPNPARDSVVFLFELPHQTETEISVFTPSGEKIVLLKVPSEQTTRGKNRKSWNAKNNSGGKIASGIYIGYLKTAFGCQTTKFAFVK